MHQVKVWDLPVRLFHWLLVALMGFSWWSAEEGGVTLQYHMWSGYAILSLVLFRILWGFVGSDTARFTNFLAGPSRILATARELFTRAPLPDAGHNALGGWMVLALLAGLLVQAGTGLFANDDIMNEGPLYDKVSKAVSDRLSEAHEVNFAILLTLVGLHVAAIAWHRWRKGEHLARAMFTGTKSLPAPVPPPRLGPVWLAAVLLAVSGGIVAAIVQF